MSSTSPGLTSSRWPSGGRYRPSWAMNRTRAGAGSPSAVRRTSTRMSAAASGRMVTRPSGLTRSRSRSAAGSSHAPTAIRASGVVARSMTAGPSGSPPARGRPHPKVSSAPFSLPSPGPPPVAGTRSRGSDRIATPRSTSGRAGPAPVTRTWRRGSRTSGFAVPWNRVRPATTTSVPGRPAPSDANRTSTSSSPAPSGIAWSQQVMSSSGVGTKSATPAWAGPHPPGSIVNGPACPAAAYRPGDRRGCGPRQSTVSSARWPTASNGRNPQPMIPSATSNRRRTLTLRADPSANWSSYSASGCPVGRTQPTGVPGARSPEASRQLSEKWATTRWLAGAVAGPRLSRAIPRPRDEVDDDLAIQHQPPGRAGTPAELEGEPAEHARPVRCAVQRLRVVRVEPGRDVRVRRIPGRGKVDRASESRGRWHPAFHLGSILRPC